MKVSYPLKRKKLSMVPYTRQYVVIALMGDQRWMPAYFFELPYASVHYRDALLMLQEIRAAAYARVNIWTPNRFTIMKISV